MTCPTIELIIIYLTTHHKRRTDTSYEDIISSASIKLVTVSSHGSNTYQYVISRSSHCLARALAIEKIVGNIKSWDYVL